LASGIFGICFALTQLLQAQPNDLSLNKDSPAPRPSSHSVGYCLCQFWTDCTTDTCVLFLGVISSALNILNVPVDAQLIAKGVIIVAALSLSARAVASE
jgi:hypothetical protein